ncbi:DNA repair protein RadC [Zooshikella marina]|uniref:JAB domain-containing protein n=1 Tax=Zooshikella ganghwensis TaxID=202772 RepID=A0A4P9VK20_9GAMM|nr:DNA repair protein RadC [Zooshikella ganghwensis]MBU2706354.1 DNA repair protein RadC [Zooshikella ganghwensis]RDH42152.1 JAB domain-containing protein [Zooshikella ganghwensis]
MAITDWPCSERPRERLLAMGASALSDAELLAIFLRTGVKGKTAVDLARELLTTFGGLRPLLEATQQEFCQAHGLGTAKYVLLQAVLEMATRHLEAQLAEGASLQSSTQTKRYVQGKLRHYTYEVFAVLYLNSQHQIIRFEELFRGTLNAAAVYPREVVKQALMLNAAAVILVHNHPSGDTEPSQSDCYITEQLQAALELIDVRVLDHLIVGNADVLSFAEKGLLIAGV